ncbi:hypothetical protein E2C01_062940 [Portunus trituberculatus]|uniref:Uncharacterized protein n=1 Tax=Portunus trituberculatus TaxID=210409 RepID=A0A5B7HF28_PORTR|nr:hypothetical protein [Portunus trituberculatus]
MTKARRVQLTDAGFRRTQGSIAGWRRRYRAAIEVQLQERHEFQTLDTAGMTKTKNRTVSTGTKTETLPTTAPQGEDSGRTHAAGRRL